MIQRRLKAVLVSEGAGYVGSIPLPPDGPKVRRPNLDLAQRVLEGWEPEVAVSDGPERIDGYFAAEPGIGGWSEA